jgi:hypothetical protein
MNGTCHEHGPEPPCRQVAEHGRRGADGTNGQRQAQSAKSIRQSSRDRSRHKSNSGSRCEQCADVFGGNAARFDPGRKKRRRGPERGIHQGIEEQEAGERRHAAAAFSLIARGGTLGHFAPPLIGAPPDMRQQRPTLELQGKLHLCAGTLVRQGRSTRVPDQPYEAMMQQALSLILAVILAVGIAYVLVGTFTEDRGDVVRPRSESTPFLPRGAPPQ